MTLHIICCHHTVDIVITHDTTFQKILCTQLCLVMTLHIICCHHTVDSVITHETTFQKILCTQLCLVIALYVKLKIKNIKCGYILVIVIVNIVIVIVYFILTFRRLTSTIVDVPHR